MNSQGHGSCCPFGDCLPAIAIDSMGLCRWLHFTAASRLTSQRAGASRLTLQRAGAFDWITQHPVAAYTTICLRFMADSDVDPSPGGTIGCSHGARARGSIGAVWVAPTGRNEFAGAWFVSSLRDCLHAIAIDSMGSCRWLHPTAASRLTLQRAGLHWITQHPVAANAPT